MGDLVFVTGGARSGKSHFAEACAADAGAPVVYLATMQAGDEELAARIAEHRRRRPAAWSTIEAPLAVADAVASAPPESTILLDCLSLWVSNRLFADGDPAARDVVAWGRFVERCVLAADEIVAAQAARPGMLIAVSNETGLGIVPADPLSRFYRDALGLVNQAFARAATAAYLLVAGLPVRLK
jgi:adenosylcobinamide kinase/adenosylcobinamide-phosphate guanylyltransferase